MYDIVIGGIYKNTRGLEYSVLEEQKRPDNNGVLRTYFLVEFLVTGYRNWSYITNVKRGSVKDKYDKIHYNVGCIGDAKITGNEKEYEIWTNMLARCYSDKTTNKSAYKDKGCKVCDRWLVFSNFLEDIIKVDNYSRELIYQGKIELDKDLKQKDINPKVYSLETTCFITKEENLKLRNINQHDSLKKVIIAISPSGEEVIVDGLRSFCRQHDLNRGVLNKVINGKQESHKGWKVKDIIEKEVSA